MTSDSKVVLGPGTVYLVGGGTARVDALALEILQEHAHLLVPAGAGEDPPPAPPKASWPDITATIQLPVAEVPGRRPRPVGPSPAQRLLARSRERARKAQKGSP